MKRPSHSVPTLFRTFLYTGRNDMNKIVNVVGILILVFSAGSLAAGWALEGCMQELGTEQEMPIRHRLRRSDIFVVPYMYGTDHDINAPLKFITASRSNGFSIVSSTLGESLRGMRRPPEAIS